MLLIHFGELPGKPEDYAPFFLQDEARRLTQGQYEAARDLYVRARFAEYRDRGRQRRARAEDELAGRWPDPIPGEPPNELTEPQIALGRLFFARTKAGQAKARAQVRKLATRGPIARRKALRAAVAATPQAKAWHSPMALLFEIVPCWARRQFMWHFLRAELLAAVRRKRDRDDVGWTLRDLLDDPTDFGAEISGLLRAYRFLGLSKAELLAGLRCRHPADFDTAPRFGLRPASLRSLLTRAFGLRVD